MKFIQEELGEDDEETKLIKNMKNKFQNLRHQKKLRKRLSMS